METRVMTADGNALADAGRVDDAAERSHVSWTVAHAAQHRVGGRE